MSEASERRFIGAVTASATRAASSIADISGAIADATDEANQAATEQALWTYRTVSGTEVWAQSASHEVIPVFGEFCVSIVIVYHVYVVS